MNIKMNEKVSAAKEMVNKGYKMSCSHVDYIMTDIRQASKDRKVIKTAEKVIKDEKVKAEGRVAVIKDDVKDMVKKIVANNKVRMAARIAMEIGKAAVFAYITYELLLCILIAFMLWGPIGMFIMACLVGYLIGGLIQAFWL